jgi:hypothetical protein
MNRITESLILAGVGVSALGALSYRLNPQFRENVDYFAQGEIHTTATSAEIARLEKSQFVYDCKAKIEAARGELQTVQKLSEAKLYTPNDNSVFKRVKPIAGQTDAFRSGGLSQNKFDGSINGDLSLTQWAGKTENTQTRIEVVDGKAKFVHLRSGLNGVTFDRDLNDELILRRGDLTCPVNPKNLTFNKNSSLSNQRVFSSTSQQSIWGN